MSDTSEPRFVESTAGEAAADLRRLGIAPDRRVMIVVEPEPSGDWLDRARDLARPRIAAEGWSDADIDRIIEEEREAVQPPPE